MLNLFLKYKNSLSLSLLERKSLIELDFLELVKSYIIFYRRYFYGSQDIGKFVEATHTGIR